MQRGMPHTTIEDARRWRAENVRHRYTPGAAAPVGAVPAPANPPGEPDERELLAATSAAQVADAERRARTEDGERIALAALERALRSWYQLAIVVVTGAGSRFEGAVRSHIADSARPAVRRELVGVERDLLNAMFGELVRSLAGVAPEWAATFARQITAEKGPATTDA